MRVEPLTHFQISNIPLTKANSTSTQKHSSIFHHSTTKTQPERQHCLFSLPLQILYDHTTNTSSFDCTIEKRLTTSGQSDALLLSKRWPVCRRSRSLRVVSAPTRKIPVFYSIFVLNHHKYWQECWKGFWEVLKRIWRRGVAIFMVTLYVYLIDLC